MFFLAQLSVSAGLLSFAPFAVWLGFVSLWNFPLLLLMAGGEFGYRRLRFPSQRHESLAGMIRAYRDVRRPQTQRGFER